MDAVIEVVLGFIGLHIYGTEKKPRLPIWKNLVRLIAFGGAAVALAGLYVSTFHFEVPMLLLIVWWAAILILMIAEYELGSRWIALAILVTLAVLVIAFLNDMGVFLYGSQ